VSALAHGMCMAVCNGSYQEDIGTAAWIVTNCSENGFIRGLTWVPGLPHDQCAFCSELAGIYSVIRMVNCLCNYYSVSKGAITLRCDGLGPLQSCFGHINPSPKIPYFDFISAIRTEIGKSVIKWN